DLVAIDGFLQVQPGGEVAVQGTDANAGPLGDVLQRRIGAVFGKRLGGGGEQAFMAAPRIRPHRRPLGQLRGRAAAGRAASSCTASSCTVSRRHASPPENKLLNRRVPPYSNRSRPPFLC